MKCVYKTHFLALVSFSQWVRVYLWSAAGESSCSSHPTRLPVSIFFPHQVILPTVSSYFLKIRVGSCCSFPQELSVAPYGIKSSFCVNTFGRLHLLSLHPIDSSRSRVFHTPLRKNQQLVPPSCSFGSSLLCSHCSPTPSSFFHGTLHHPSSTRSSPVSLVITHHSFLWALLNATGTWCHVYFILLCAVTKSFVSLCAEK